jgi:hypothetical protein
MDQFGVALEKIKQNFGPAEKQVLKSPFSTRLVQQFAQEMTKNWKQFVDNTVHFNFPHWSSAGLR